MKVSSLGTDRASSPSYKTKSTAKKNKPHKGQGKGTVPKKSFKDNPSSFRAAVNKNLQKLNPKMRSTQTKKMGRAVRGMIHETTGRYNLTQP